MAEAIVSVAVDALSGLIVREVRTLFSGRRDRLMSAILNAQKHLKLASAFLIGADARRSNDEVLSHWVAKVQDAAYDMEDVIQSYLLKEKPSRRNGSSWKKIIAYACIGDCIGPFDISKTESEIIRISSLLDDLTTQFTRYGIVDRRPPGAHTSQSVVSGRRMTSSYAHDPELLVVGRYYDVRLIVESLVREENSPRVVSVWGMGGIGKTTIAKLVYKEVREHFECTAWVSLSQEFQSRDVFEDILVMLTGPNNEERREIARMNAQEIVTKLHTIQQKRRCLVVLDDLWTGGWDSLKPGFPAEKTKSKILLTTRMKEVARLPLHAGLNVFLHEAQPLTMDESWSLFEKLAFAHEGDDSTDSTRIEKMFLGEKMVRNCEGVPLAILLLAGLLAGTRVEKWRIVSKNVGAYLKVMDTSNVFALSYGDLPNRLQICFQYLASFPKNYEIPVKTLTQLWMAEGLIAPESLTSAGSIEDTSYGYLNELVERCMVQVAEHSLTGKIKTIRLDESMLKLCREKAERENFLHIVNSSEATQTQAASSKKVRRLAVHLDRIGHEIAPPTDERHASLRSLIFFVKGHYYSDIYGKLLRSLCQDFKLLRVLKFEDMKAEPEIELPSNIGKLVHLRFLSLKNSEIKRLPSSVANLVRLQILDLRSAEWVSVKIPNVFRKMAELRHLYLPLNHRVTEKLTLATLRNLQTLVNISSEDCDLKDLIELTGLRKLVLHAWEPTKFKTLEGIMRDREIRFDHLQSLSLVTGNGNGDISTHMVLSCPHLLKLQLSGRIKEFPEGDQFSKLVKLTLEETDLQDCHIERLEKLPRLEVLSLRMGAFKSETMVFSEGGFRRLKNLSLIGLCELKEWTVARGAMPNLSSLHIGYCWGLGAVPDGLQHISTLKNLSINHMYSQFCNRIEKGGADFDKVKHASVTITDSRNIQGKALSCLCVSNCLKL